MSGDLYSARNGRARRLEHGDFADLIWRTLIRLHNAGYFDQALFEHEEPAGIVVGPRLWDPEGDFVRRLRANDIFRQLTQRHDWAPLSWRGDADVIWDTLEYLRAEIVAEPSPAKEYDRESGRVALRAALNPDLALFEPPMEMTSAGEIVERSPEEFHALIDAPVADDVPAPLRDPLEAAIEQYRRRGASEQDKRSALKHLADVLEPLRSQIDQYVLSADERALF